PAQQAAPGGFTVTLELDEVVASDEPGMDAGDPVALPAGDGAMPAESPFTPAQVARLKALYAALEPPAQEEMRAYYRDLGVDLEQALGLAAERGARQQRGMEVSGEIRNLDFERKPEAVLKARATLGFGQVAHPNPESATPAEIARWIHLQVMAGEWKAFAEFLAKRPVEEAEPVFAAILQSTNRGDTGLLPEEVLLFADASPAELKPWAVKALGRMLAQSASKYATGAMLALVEGGTRWFGPADEASRRRTAELLAEADLLAEAYRFLPPLEDAIAREDGAQMTVHARHLAELARKAGDGPEGEALRVQAFRTLAAVALLAREKSEIRLDALAQAVAAMREVPKSQAEPWLAEVFASPALGPAALEQLALVASSLANQGAAEETRASAILGLKESIDILLERDDVDLATLRVPLRMVTTALVAAMEDAAKAGGGGQGGMRGMGGPMVGRDAQILLRAIPSERWLSALEPSLASRARKAAVAIAASADETDRALALLDDAIAASPAEAGAFADAFLAIWVERLQPMSQFPPEMQMFFAFNRDAMPMAPLTRGRQRRNLDRLDALMATLREAGVDPRTLPSIVGAFEACHAQTEVYTKADIERVFGPIERIPPATAATLAAKMGGSLNGDWRNREVQSASGVKRSDSEIARLVEAGYGVAIELASSAVRQRPEAWNLAVLEAGLTYDRLQFKDSQKSAQDPAERDAYRRAAFEAFADAAHRYAGALARGETRDDPSVHLRWFGAAMGTAELNFLRPEDLPREGTLQDDQIDLIRRSLATLDAEAFERHLAAFAEAVQGAVERSAPEVKPRLVRHALRVIGEHPAGASLRAIEELHRDLVRNEIRLRLAIDGDDRVGTGEPFALLLSLRFTHSVDRETGGFSKYLQNGVFARVGNQFRQVNYRDQLQKAIEEALTSALDVEAIGYFDAYMPPRGVVEDGDAGWLEKPLAYIVVSRRDPTVDTVPSISMEMQFTDQAGPVTLLVPSNTPLLAPGEARAARPCGGLAVTQLVDLRGAEGDAGDRTVTLEVRMRGKGVLPDLREALAGLDDALAGYAIGTEDGIEADPPMIASAGTVTASPMFMMGAPQAPKDGYPEPDADGLYRMEVERTWRVKYLPTGGAVGPSFRLPTLVAGIDGSLESRFYDELDIAVATGATVPVRAAFWTPGRMAATVVGLISIVVLAIRGRRRRAPIVDTAPAWTPTRLTPLAVVTSLRALAGSDALDGASREALRREIVELELKWFGRGATADTATEADLRSAIERWDAAGRAATRG
ncbi:MAG: hypothetical protein RI967_1493, partial [Planctomycetota bacterium]